MRVTRTRRSVLADIFSRSLRCLTSLLLTLAIFINLKIFVSLRSFEMRPIRENREILLKEPTLKIRSNGIIDTRSVRNQLNMYFSAIL